MYQYSIERISSANLHHFQELYISTYSKNVSMESLVGKYTTKMFGAEWIGYLAFTPDSKPAAFYGVIPCHFRINDEIVLAAQSADTMTHPKHRQKGLFMQLAQRTFDLARLEGVKFIFGFANQNSYPGFVKLNWTFLKDRMQLFILKGSVVPWSTLALKIPVVKDFFEPDIKNDFRLLNTTGGWSEKDGVFRNELFFQHKIQYTKTFVKKSDNLVAWIKNDGLLKVGLLNFVDETDPNAIKQFLTQTARRLGCHSIILMTSRDTKLYKALIKLTPATDGLHIGFYNLADKQIDFSKVMFEYCDIDIF